jgi:hypothetical protein
MLKREDHVFKAVFLAAKENRAQWAIFRLFAQWVIFKMKEKIRRIGGVKGGINECTGILQTSQSCLFRKLLALF